MNMLILSIVWSQALENKNIWAEQFVKAYLCEAWSSLTLHETDNTFTPISHMKKMRCIDLKPLFQEHKTCALQATALHSHKCQMVVL